MAFYSKAHTIDLGILREHKDLDYVLQYSNLEPIESNLSKVDQFSITSAKVFKEKSKRQRFKKLLRRVLHRSDVESLCTPNIKDSLLSSNASESILANKSEYILSNIKSAQSFKANTYFSSLYPMNSTQLKYNDSLILRKNSLNFQTTLSTPSPRPKRKTSIIITRTAISSLISVSRNFDQDTTIHHSLLRQPPLLEVLDEKSLDSPVSLTESYYSFEMLAISKVNTRRGTIIRREVRRELPSPIDIDSWIDEL